MQEVDLVGSMCPVALFRKELLEAYLLALMVGIPLLMVEGELAFSARRHLIHSSSPFPLMRSLDLVVSVVAEELLLCHLEEVVVLQIRLVEVEASSYVVHQTLARPLH